MVERKKSANNNLVGPETLVRDNETRWLSTFKMIDRFIYFRDEIKDLLRAASVRKRSDDLGLDCCEITEAEWEYLTELRDVLRVFRGPIIKLPAFSYATINQTIPCVMKLLDALETKKSEELEKKNPYFAIGITMARSKIIDYFPVYDNNIEKMKNLYSATVLDPRYKLKFFREVKFSNERIMEIEAYFHEVFDRYSEEAEDEVIEVTPKKSKRDLLRVLTWKNERTATILEAMKRQ